MTPAPDEIPQVTPLAGKNKPAGNEPEITDEPDDVKEQSPEVFREFKNKNDEAMKEMNPDSE